MMHSFSVGSYLKEIEKELKDNILPFWINNTVDDVYGGFYGYISNEQVTGKSADKGCILNSRILWTFSAAYRKFGNEDYLKIAKQAFEYLKDCFWDNEYSGLYWMSDYKGQAVNTRKQLYNIAFGIYGLSEYHMATGDMESLNRAVKLFYNIEEYGYDRVNKGYIEALARDWKPIEDLRLSEMDMNGKKSMNTHLHILEAYTNLYRVWKYEFLKTKLRELINVTIEHIVDPEEYHFKLFFGEGWNIKSKVVSFGHDIEGSWLLYEAASVLGEKDVLEKVKAIAVKMAQRVYDRDIDNKYGEWFWKASESGKVCNEFPKVEPWKCPYHNGRTCMKLIERLKGIS